MTSCAMAWRRPGPMLQVPADTVITQMHAASLPGRSAQSGARPGDLTSQHRLVVPEDHDLRVLGRLAAAKPAGHSLAAEFWSGTSPSHFR
jgi:hypothetical protein